MDKGVLKGVPGPEIIQITAESEEKYVRMSLVILIWAYFRKKDVHSNI